MVKRKQRDQEAEVPQSNVQDSSQPKKRQQKPKAKTEPFDLDNDWIAVPPSMIYRKGTTVKVSKIAAFDFDGTLAVTKTGMDFPRTAEDFKLYNKKVAKVLQQIVDDGYQLVIFSNQGGVKSKLDGAMSTKVRKRIDLVCNECKVNPWVVLATLDDDNRKPAMGMFNKFQQMWEEDSGMEIDLEQSYFVGDAAGRPGDIGDSDKKFAEAIGIQFKLPNDVFGEQDGKKSTTGLKSDVNHNPEMSAIFAKLAEYCEALGGNGVYQARTYRTASSVIAGFPSKITAGKQALPYKGIGKTTVQKIDEFLETGTLEELGEEGLNLVQQQKETVKKDQGVASKFM